MIEERERAMLAAIKQFFDTQSAVRDRAMLGAISEFVNNRMADASAAAQRHKANTADELERLTTNTRAWLRRVLEGEET
jgi:hypothetical protein